MGDGRDFVWLLIRREAGLMAGVNKFCRVTTNILVLASSAALKVPKRAEKRPAADAVPRDNYADSSVGAAELSQRGSEARRE